MKDLVLERLHRTCVHERHVVQYEPQVDACDAQVLVDLPDPIQCVRGMEGAPLRRLRIRQDLARSPNFSPQRVRKFGENALGRPPHHRKEVLSQKDFASKTRVRQDDVVEVVRQAGEPDRHRIRSEICRQRHPIHCDHQAMFCVILRRLEKDARPAGTGDPGTWLPCKAASEVRRRTIEIERADVGERRQARCCDAGGV